MDPAARTLGETLRAHRMAAAMTQFALARAAAVSVRALRDIENDRVRRPHLLTLVRLSQALRLPPTEQRRILSATRDEAPAPGLRVDVLGPLLVRRDGVVLGVRAYKQRVLLGLLALRPGQPVSLGVIADALWRDPPPTYAGLVHTYVARLRRTLPPGAIVLDRDGYLLATDGLGSDALEFEELVCRAREQGRPDRALPYLAQALRCWRGPVFADADVRLAHHPAAAALTRLRGETGLALGDAAVRSGLYEAAIEPLRALIEADPLNEALHAGLMLALAGSGQQAAALQLYADVSARLTAELGVRPGAELAAAHLRVLRQDLPPPGIADGFPAQLPADLADFTGRERELDRLAVLTAPHSQAMVVCAITGPPGVGKTALAVHWAHRIAGRFPDGQLYLDLRGFSADPPLRPIDALRFVLTAYGLAPHQIPAGEEAASALVRTLLATRRTLLVLDNAASAEQVRPLLPGTPSCLVLVTSRDRLDGLVATAGARRIGLDVLTASAAAGLLARIVGPGRVAAEPDAVGELAQLCGFLPLALCVAGAQLAGDQIAIEEYVAELRSENKRMARLSAGNDAASAVRTAFDRSYAALSTTDRRLFRLAGWAPGRDLTADAASALAGISAMDAADALDRLTRAHLVQRRAGGRFGLHDLLRLYAAERCRAEDTDAQRDTALVGLLDWLQSTASQAAGLLFPQMMRLHPPPDDARPAFADRAAALAWLDAEHVTMVAAIRAAGPRWPVVGRVANALRGFLEHRRHLDDWLIVAEIGIAAFAAARDARGAAVCRMGLAIAYGCRAEFDLARTGFEGVLADARQHGWHDVQATTLNNLGYLAQHIGDLEPAADRFAQALALYRQIGWAVGQASTLGSLGSIACERGQWDDAERYLLEALDIAQQAEAVGVQALGHEHLGRIWRARGDTVRALESLQRAADTYREVGNRHGEATIRNELAMVHMDSGDLDQARSLAVAARTLATEIGYATVRVAAVNTLAALDLRCGDAPGAIAGYEYALELAESLQQRSCEVDALVGLAEAYTASGDLRRALAAARRAVERARRRGFQALEARAQELRTGIRASGGAHGRRGDVVDVPDPAGRDPHQRAGR